MKNKKNFFDENYSSKIRRVIFPLNHYSPKEKGSKTSRFNQNYIERKKLELKMRRWIDGKDGNEYGSYLVTGYRGMGKTQFVEKVLHDICKEDNNVRKRIIVDIFFTILKIFCGTATILCLIKNCNFLWLLLFADIIIFLIIYLWITPDKSLFIKAEWMV